MGQRGLKRTSMGLYNIELSFLEEERKGWNKANVVALAGSTIFREARCPAKKLVSCKTSTSLGLQLAKKVS